MKYLEWSHELPSTPDDAFISFISNNSPLSQKLREKWLFQLANASQWEAFHRYYQSSTNISLQCYDIFARYQLGQQHEALESAKILWFTTAEENKACSMAFSLLQQHHMIDTNYTVQRLNLLLEQQKIHNALHLLQQYTPAQQKEAQYLNSIYIQPKRILTLTPSALHSAYYFYGLMRLASTKLDIAVQLWQQKKTKQFLNYKQQQKILAQIALYKAMHNQQDAKQWFDRVHPAFYNEKLLDWEIRYALKYQQWARVQQLINHSSEKDTPCWQYWFARAIDAQGHHKEAHELYAKLSETRNYYGFLASRHLGKAYHFEDEPAVENTRPLHAYKVIIDEIKKLYLSNEATKASLLLNDFASELPKDDKSALAYWIAHDLQWHGKSVNLSNSIELSNQLSLRFPLAYKNTVENYAYHYQIPKGLIFAIIRQESSFRTDAGSSAGAQGLMQLMPATAKIISKEKKISYKNPKQLLNSQTNINLGVAYLHMLAKQFRAHPILMAAAYNAGPRQVSYWIKNQPQKNIDIWIETLPWLETRNYLKNIVAFYAVYQYRLHEKPDLTPLLQTPKT